MLQSKGWPMRDSYRVPQIFVSRRYFALLLLFAFRRRSGRGRYRFLSWRPGAVDTTFRDGMLSEDQEHHHLGGCPPQASISLRTASVNNLSYRMRLQVPNEYPLNNMDLHCSFSFTLLCPAISNPGGP